MATGGDNRDAMGTGAEKDRWEEKYRKEGRLWGEDPSVLAVATIRFLERLPDRHTPRLLVDLGCGYGRDTVALARGLPDDTFLGVDSSVSAVEAATRRCLEAGLSNVRIRCADFRELHGERADIVYCSNLYHLLRIPEREEFRSVVREVLNPGGFLFLSTLSARDPEHGGNGDPVPGDPGSFVFPGEDLWLHFATRKELSETFGFLTIVSLSEIEYIERRVGGDHHHISWVLIGQRNGNGN
ncbi:MAG: class I SAM-dependent methyltransferase [Methanoregulaceae archaeon]|nr:class I SAM-dependent methyltransferase [Methanoregulaceae archaeon]